MLDALHQLDQAARLFIVLTTFGVIGYALHRAAQESHGG